MKQKLVIARVPDDAKGRVAVALIENGKAAELYFADPEEQGILGNIYVGHVSKVNPASGGAFVRFDGQQEGYLPAGKTKGAFYKNSKKTAEIKAEDELLVQVETEAVKTKQPGLSAELKLAGKYLVVSSGFAGLRFSRKLDEEARVRLNGLLAEKAGAYGMILRSACAQADEEEICSEAEMLLQKLQDIVRFGMSRPWGTCLYAAEPVWTEKFRQISEEDLESAVTDDPAIREQLLQCVPESKKTDRDYLRKIRLYEDPMVSLYRLQDLGTLTERALSEKVWLPSGGFLVIQQTEAFVCIDVNSGKNVGKKRGKEEIFAMNAEAAQEAARQIRLRQLSGTILIDFLNMRSKELEAALLQKMAELVKTDPGSVIVVDMTALGIMELTRKKRGRSLQEQLRQI